MSELWREIHHACSPAVERRMTEELFEHLLAMRSRKAAMESAQHPCAGFSCFLQAADAIRHAATFNARLQFFSARYLPHEFRHGFFQPDATLRTTVQFSNAGLLPTLDAARDLRRVSIRVEPENVPPRDLVFANAAAMYAEDAVQLSLIKTAFQQSGGLLAMAGTPGSVLAALRRLANELYDRAQLGLLRAKILGAKAKFEDARMLLELLDHTCRSARWRSLVTQSYWSRLPFQLGGQAVKLILRHTTDAVINKPLWPCRYLRQDFQERLMDRPVEFDLCIQPFIDEPNTPIEDASIPWDERASRPQPVARLVIPPQMLNPYDERQIGKLDFDCWNHVTDDFLRPLGRIHRAQKLAAQLQPA